jgi:DNA-binding CsgD family transcriptional regulator
MSALEATERYGAGSGSVVSVPRFTGRDRDLAALATALASPPAVVLVEGEAGIGKSRLVREYLAGAGMRALVTCCPPFRRPHTLGAVADALRRSVTAVGRLRLSSLAGALRPLFPEWAGDLPPALEPAEDASVARHRLFGAVEELIGRLGVDLLVVEDVHWADEATLEFLLHLASRAATAAAAAPAGAGQPLSLVITCRPEEVPEDSLLRRLSRLAAGSSGRRLTVGPLGVAQTAALVSSMLADEPVSERFAAFLCERTDGLPLAVEESVRLMSERSDLAFRNGAWERRPLDFIEVPPTVRDAVLERAARLSADARAVLRAVAVLTDPASEAVVRAVTGLPPGRARAGLSEGLACGLLAHEDGGLVAFRHMLACQATYESIPGPDTSVLHRRAGGALESLTPPPAALLTRHFRHAGDTAKWSQYAEMAASLALASGDIASAADILGELLTRADLPAPTVARLTRMLPFGAIKGEVRFQELFDILERVLAEGTLTPGEEADVRVQMGRGLSSLGRWAEGRAQIEAAIPHLDHDPGRQATAMMMLAWPFVTALPAEAHLRWLRSAENLAVTMEPADRLKFAVDRASALLMLGAEQGWVEAAKIPGHAPTALEMRYITFAHVNIGDAALRWGRYREAASRLKTALELARGGQFPGLYDGALVTQMHLDWFTGSWDGLADRAAAMLSDNLVNSRFRLEASLISGLLEAAAGARAQADARLHVVHSQAWHQAEWEYAIEPAAALARLWLANGRAADAVAITEAPIRIVADKGVWLWAADLAPARMEALAAVGELDEADGLVRSFTQGLGGLPAPAARTGLMTCEAILAAARAEHAQAAALFARAAAAWQALPRPYDALLAREQQARNLLAAGDDRAARPVLSDLLDPLQGLGASGDADRVARTLRELGARAQVSRGRGRPGYGASLSPRELEVVRLVAAGSTNQQVADALVVSRQTVASHVQSAMRKLRVSSRAALAVSAAERGLLDGSGDEKNR